MKDEVARAAKRTKEASSRSVVISMQKVESESRRERSKVHLSKSGVEKKVIEEAGYYGTWIPGGLQGPKVSKPQGERRYKMTSEALCDD